jgi:hypothetical protein
LTKASHPSGVESPLKYPEKPDELDAQTIQEILNSFPALELLQQHPIPHALTHNRKLLFVNKSAVKLFDYGGPMSQDKKSESLS